MDYGICRVEKVKASAVGAMQYHNDRLPGEHGNEDIDPKRTPENQELCRHSSYQTEVQNRIDRYRKSDRKVRKDAVVLVEGIVTATPEWFENHTDEEAKAFFNDAFEFVKDFMGEENMVHFTIHMDETTPHAHWGATPIKDGALSWKKFFDGKRALQAFQDKFFEQVSSKHGLARGEKDTGRKHKDTQQMKRDAQREVSELKEEAEALRGAIEVANEDLDRATNAAIEAEQRLECLQRQIEEAEPAAVTVAESARTLLTARSDGERETVLAGEVESLRSRISELEGANQRARERVAELDRGLPRLRDRAGDLERSVVVARERIAELARKVTGVLVNIPGRVAELLRGFGVQAFERQAPPDLRARAAAAVAGSVSLASEKRSMTSAAHDSDLNKHARTVDVHRGKSR